MRRALYGILVIVGISLMVIPMSVPVFKSNAPYSVLNTGWNGTSSFGKMLYSGGSVVPVLGPYDSAGISDAKGTLVVIAPDVAFSGAEIDALKTFLRNGGVLLLADDSKEGNGLLRALGLPQRLSRKKLVSLTYSKSYLFPLTGELSPELKPGVAEVIFKDPAVVLNATSEGGVVLVRSSNASRLGDSYGSFPLVVKVPYGPGRVLIVSDPDIFTNALFKENEPFLKNLIAPLPKTFYIDEAHHADFNPYSSGTMVIRRGVSRGAVFYYMLFVAFVVLFIESGLHWRILRGLFSLLDRFVPGEEVDINETLKRLEEKGFDREKLRKIVDEIESGSKLGGAHGR